MAFQPEASAKQIKYMRFFLRESGKMLLTIRFKFKVNADSRHSSVAARMPRFRIADKLCSRLSAAKLPSAHIFRLRILSQYSGVPTRKCPR